MLVIKFLFYEKNRIKLEFEKNLKKKEEKAKITIFW